MLHALADPIAPAPYAEAVARLAGVRHALRLVEPFGGGPASDFDSNAIAEAWPDASEATRRCVERRSAETVASAASGLEAMVAEHDAGRVPNSAASQMLADRIRAELEDICGLMLRD